MNTKIIIFAIISTILFLTLPAISALEWTYSNQKEENQITETKTTNEKNEQNIEIEKYFSETPQQSGIIIGLLQLIWNVIKWSLTSDGILAVILKCNVVIPMIQKLLGSVLKMTLRILGIPKMIFGGLLNLFFELWAGMPLTEIIIGLIKMFNNGIFGD